MKYLDVIVRLLDFVLGVLASREHKKEQQEQDEIRNNPRDFFDDGMLNNSQSESKPSKLSSTVAPRQPK